MNYLYFKKLIVVDYRNKNAKEIILSNRLNLIIGKNKTGKSSLVKSILHTLGCEMRFDDSWENLIDYYYLEISNGDSNFIFVRDKNYFYLKENEQSMYQVFETYEEFSIHFYKIFNINLKITNTNGESVTPTPALLFCYQFIDQDNGWNNIPNKFPNIKHFFEADKMSLLYITDTLPNEFFIKKENKDILKKKINVQEKNIKDISQFLDTLYKKLEVKKLPESSKKTLHEDAIIQLVNSIDKTEKQIIELKKLIITEQNSISQNRKILAIVKANINELVKDINYSNSLSQELVCPICLTKHTNDFSNKLGLISEKDELESLKKETRLDIKASNNRINTYEIEVSELEIEVKTLNQSLEVMEGKSTFLENAKQEGISEMVNTSKEIHNEQIKQLDNMYAEFKKLENEVSNLASKKTTSALTKSLKDLFYNNAFSLNLELKSPSFSNYKPDLKNYSGSDLTRAIYAYYLAVFEYITFKTSADITSSYPFKFLIIDSPNHQGQDDDNLSIIYSRLQYLNILNGQLIMVTERPTGFEDIANVLEVNNYRNMLNKTDYQKNSELINDIVKISSNPTFK